MQLSMTHSNDQQPRIRYQHKGTDQDTHDMHGQQEMDLGRQCAYTRVRSLPTEGHVKTREIRYFTLGNWV